MTTLWGKVTYILKQLSWYSLETNKLAQILNHKQCQKCTKLYLQLYLQQVQVHMVQRKDVYSNSVSNTASNTYTVSNVYTATYMLQKEFNFFCFSTCCLKNWRLFDFLSMKFFSLKPTLTPWGYFFFSYLFIPTGFGNFSRLFAKTILIEIISQY